MSFRDLPTDILRLVFKEAYTDRGDVQRSYRANLQLAAVCHRWRRVAFPIVHNTVDFFYDCLGRASKETHGANGTHGRLGIKTNLDLITAAGCMGSVRSVVFTIRHATNTLINLDAAVQAMRAPAERWGGARLLGIHLTTPRITCGTEVSDGAEYDGNVARIHSALVAMLPGVRDLQLSKMDQDPATLQLFWRLEAHYADQLCILNTTNPVNLPPGTVFKQVRQVCINSSATSGYQPPCMDPSRLVSLGLDGYPSDHSWAPFSPDGSSRTIVFPRLRSFVARYVEPPTNEFRTTQDPDKRPWSLCFPALKRLSLMCNQGTCSLVKCAVLPARMDELNIHVSTGILLAMAGMRFPSTKHLTISVHLTAEDYIAALDAASHIFENAQDGDDLKLDIMSSPLPIPPEIISTRLTKLEISPTTSADTMLGLIRGLPNLTNLKLWKLWYDDVQADISVPEPTVDCLVTPFNTRIKSMLLRVASGQQERELFATLVKYLMLMVPELGCVIAERAPKRPIVEFVEAYSVWYPHLSGIVLKLDERDDVLPPAPINIAALQSLLLG